MRDRPKFIARRSAWRAVKWQILVSYLPIIALSFITPWFLIALLVPTIILIWRIFDCMHETIEFYDNRIVVVDTWLVKREHSFALLGLLSVTMHKSIIGRILNYGTVKLDVVGKCDIDTTFIKNPETLISYLNSVLSKTNRNVTKFIGN